MLWNSDSRNGRDEKGFGKSHLEDLYFRHASSLRCYLLSRGAGEDVAGEIIQDIFQECCRNPDRFLGAKNPKAYLLGAAFRQVARQRLKTEALGQRFVVDGKSLDLFEAKKSGQSEEDKEQAQALSRAVLKLAEELRSVVILHAFNGLSFDEIGEITQSPADTCYRRYRRALEQLKMELKSYLEE